MTSRLRGMHSTPVLNPCPKTYDNKRSHTVITESAIHRNFDVQYIEDILQNVSTLSIKVRNERRKRNIEN